jgi:hypothetical protein
MNGVPSDENAVSPDLTKSHAAAKCSNAVKRREGLWTEVKDTN